MSKQNRSILIAGLLVWFAGAGVARAAGLLEMGYSIEFPITTGVVAQNFIGDTWWELAWSVPMDPVEHKLIYPRSFCDAHNIKPTNGACLMPIPGPDTVVVRATCLDAKDDGVTMALKPDYLGIGNNLKCDRRFDDTSAGFAPNDTCLHPAVSPLGKANFSYLSSELVKGLPPPSAHERGLTFSCRWLSDPGRISNPRIRFDVYHFEADTFVKGGDPVAIVDPPARSLGQVVTGSTGQATFSYSNVGWGMLRPDLARFKPTGSAAELEVVVPRNQAPQPSLSIHGYHREPPLDQLAVGGSLPFDAVITAGPAGPWRTFTIAAPSLNGGLTPKVNVRYHPVSTLTAEIAFSSFPAVQLYATKPNPTGQRTLEIFNEGGDRMAIGGLRLMGGDAALFSLPQLRFPLFVEPHTSTRITIEFKPPQTVVPKSYKTTLDVAWSGSAINTGSHSTLTLDGTFVP